MSYNIIASGSDGNAVLINDEILIDCGVTFRKLEPFYKKIKLVLLTHVHIDHFNESTIKKLSIERPGVRFGCCEWLYERLLNLGIDKSRIDIYKLDMLYKYSDFYIMPFKLFHDVEQCGYRIFANGKKLIYATDTSKIDHIEAYNYDVYLIEANYESDFELHSRAYTREYEDRVRNTHLSVEQATDWLLKNMSETSVYEFLHRHKEKPLARRFLEIEPLLNNVTKITLTQYKLTDDDIYSAMEELLSSYNNLVQEFNEYKSKSKLIFEGYDYGE